MRTLPGFMPKYPSSLIVAALLAAVVGSVACGPSSDPDTFDIVFTLTDTPTPLKTLSLEVRYDSGDFAGNGDTVACSLTASSNQETLVASDNQDDGVLDIAIDASEKALTEGSNIFDCNFLSSRQPTADDFEVTVTEAINNHDHPADPSEISVVVTSTSVISSTTAAAGLTR